MEKQDEPEKDRPKPNFDREACLRELNKSRSKPGEPLTQAERDYYRNEDLLRAHFDRNTYLGMYESGFQKGFELGVQRGLVQTMLRGPRTGREKELKDELIHLIDSCERYLDVASPTHWIKLAAMDDIELEAIVKTLLLEIDSPHRRQT